MELRRLPVVLFLAAHITLGACFGDIGHRTISFLAQHYISSKGSYYAQLFLNGMSLDDASIWADEYKKIEGPYTTSWHFVDARDDPPASCSVVYQRDCQPQRTCIIAAMKNMTSRLRDPSLPQDQRSQAFKMAIHLIGDVHTPLHTEGVAKGGNDIKVKFSGVDRSLHFIWDVSILQKRTDTNDSDSVSDQVKAAKKWADELYRRSSSRVVKQEQIMDAYPASAMEDFDAADPEKYMLSWAQQVNAYVCRYVLRDGRAGVDGRELSGPYYDGAVPVVEELIMLAGQRLGLWISAMAEIPIDN